MRAADHAQLVLHNGGGGRKLHIGRGGGHHNQVDIFGSQTGIIQRPAGGGHSQIAGLLVIGGNVRNLMPVRLVIHSSEVSTF